MSFVLADMSGLLPRESDAMKGLSELLMAPPMCESDTVPADGSTASFLNTTPHATYLTRPLAAGTRRGRPKVARVLLFRSVSFPA